MTAPLAHDFPLMSALSTRPPHTVAIGEMRAELATEELHRLDVYPRRVAKGRISRDQMQHHLELWRAIRRDVAEPVLLAAYAGDAGEPLTIANPARVPPFTWEDKVRELRGELAYRRNAYPLAVKQQRGDAHDLGERMARLEAVHFLYWLRLEYYDAPLGRDRAEWRAGLRARDDAATAWIADAVDRREPAVAGWAFGVELARWHRARTRAAAA